MSSAAYDHGSGVDPDHGDDTRIPERDTIEDCVDALGRPRESAAGEYISDRVKPGAEWPARDDLPGRGSAYGDCGDWLPHFCEGCGDPTDGSRRCQRASCPECWESWARKTATSVGSRALALRAMLDASRSEHVKLHHVTFSLPKEQTFEAADPTERALDCVREFLHALDIPAVVIYHPYRIDDDIDYDDGPFDDSRGKWKHLLGRGDSMSDVDGDLSFAPHFHVIAVTDWFPGNEFTTEVHERTGWVFKRITKHDSNASIYGNEDLAAVLTYSLSHCGIYENSNGDQAARYRYIGRQWDDVTVMDRYREQFDATVREVAPRTLGVPFKQLACHTEVLNPADLKVHVGRGRAAAADAANGGSSSSASSGSSSDASSDDDGDDLGSAGSVPDDHDGTEVQLNGSERCEGRLLPPWEIEDYFRDDDWREQAEHASDGLKVLYEWRKQEELEDLRERTPVRYGVNPNAIDYG